MGKKVVALITDMDQPLGLKVGNSLEVEEVLDVLQGEGPADLRELCIELASWMFHLGGAVPSLDEGKQRAAQMIDSGRGLAKFREMVKLQGGDLGAIDDPKKLPRAKHTLEVLSPENGFVSAIACEAVGTACVILGGGREKKEDSVDPAVGIVLHKKPGDAVSAREPIAAIHYNADSRAERAKTLVQESYRISGAPPEAAWPLVHRVIQGSGGKN